MPRALSFVLSVDVLECLQLDCVERRGRSRFTLLSAVIAKFGPTRSVGTNNCFLTAESLCVNPASSAQQRPEDDQPEENLILCNDLGDYNKIETPARRSPGSVLPGVQGGGSRTPRLPTRPVHFRPACRII